MVGCDDQGRFCGGDQSISQQVGRTGRSRQLGLPTSLSSNALPLPRELRVGCGSCATGNPASPVDLSSCQVLWARSRVARRRGAGLTFVFSVWIAGGEFALEGSVGQGHFCSGGQNISQQVGRTSWPCQLGLLTSLSSNALPSLLQLGIGYGSFAVEVPAGSTIGSSSGAGAMGWIGTGIESGGASLHRSFAGTGVSVGMASS